MLRTALRTAAVATAALLSVGLAGSVAEAAPASPSDSRGLCVFYHGQIVTCFTSNSGNWGQYGREAEGLWNNAYPGGNDDALVYWGVNHTGAWKGICNGALLPDLGGLIFEGGAAGSGQSLWHNISSSRWASLGGPCA